MDKAYPDNILNETLKRMLAVVPSGLHRRRTAQQIYRNMIGLGFAVDIVVVTEDDIEQFKNHIGMIIKPALEEGKVLYAA